LEEKEEKILAGFSGFSRRPRESSRYQTNLAICGNRATSEFVLGRANPCRASECGLMIMSGGPANPRHSPGRELCKKNNGRNDGVERRSIDPKEKLWSGKGLMNRVFRIRLSSAVNSKIKRVI
jgi:hypothetical protein